MELEGKVSLWLGNFNDEETFRSFMEINYTDNNSFLEYIGCVSYTK